MYFLEDKFQLIEKITEKLRTKIDYKSADEVNSDLDQIQQIIKEGE